MLAYVAIDKFELYESIYGKPDFKFDVTKFDVGLERPAIASVFEPSSARAVS
jgi:hypothetical protein